MLARRLKELREENNYTQQDMAEKIGLKRAAYGAYERGINTPDAQTLLKLAEIFDVTTDYLLGRGNVLTREEQKYVDLQISGIQSCPTRFRLHSTWNIF